MWLAIAAATGGAWVFYYVDAPSMLFKIFRGEASTEVYVFIGLLTATTYTLAGWAREQVCTYMCPWPRFQAAMLDEQSVIVTYQKWRGEQRGKVLPAGPLGGGQARGHPCPSQAMRAARLAMMPAVTPQMRCSFHRISR